MKPPFNEHPFRAVLALELHARPYEPLHAPERLSHIAYVTGETGTGRNHAHLARLCERFGARMPSDDANHFSADMGGFRVRWERHTEFCTYTFFRNEPFGHPFSETAINLVPNDWLADLPGEVLAAAHLAVETAETPVRSIQDLSRLFAGNTVIGSAIAGGAGMAWTDLQVHEDQFSRILVQTGTMNPRQTGRHAQRILEINAYRAMALLALPLAREASPRLQTADRRLADIAARLAQKEGDAKKAEPDKAMLDQLSALAADIEEVEAATAYRFGATKAYYGIVQQRLEELRQERITGLQTFSEFLERRMEPAMATCDHTKQRQRDLAERAARLTSLLRARVEVELEEQNRGLLESMNRRALLQLRLQQTVEGLSVVAISYYLVSLVTYALKGMKSAGIPFAPDPDIGTGIALPLVIALVWLGVKRLRKAVLRTGG
ncbi:MAG: DUF3422 domain-containing protein, partial [Rhodospirillales bacterium]|nr:DUF3422 domain-containing protein [Rhodospirillales bacterium]